MANLNLKIVFALTIAICLLPSYAEPSRPMPGNKLSNLGSVNGGDTCLECTVIVTLLQQFMQVHDLTPEESIDFLCDLFPGAIHDACVVLGVKLKEDLIDKLNSTDNADVICYSLGSCFVTEGYHYCHLFPEPAGGMAKAVQASKARINRTPITELMPLCQIPGLQEVCKLFNLGDADDKTPTFDEDNDAYSTVEVLRGYDWRGQDCNDSNPEVYPGRLPLNSDIDFDSNCNGIWGVNPDTGIPYEEELCGDQDNYGIIIIGDSVSAHFHVPPDWFRANVTSAELWKNVTVIASDELDWPHMSYGTGFVNGTWPVTINTPTNSLYWRMRNRNLCVHRDYQNLAFNGAQSTTAQEHSLNMTRDEGKDKPVVLFYAEFGNDICGSSHGIPEEMTSKDEFNQAVRDYLDYLDTRLPFNSHVVLVGLLNGTYLYDILKGRLHPIGELNQDITYDDYYNWLDCMQTLCPAYLNTNVTKQTEATNYAFELSDILQQITVDANYSRFDVHFLNSPMEEAIETWTGERWELIEPVDGLHPSKNGQDIFANVMWDFIVQNFPEILEDVNPNNDKIIELFGDQGGH